jgi:hypothetical protein
LACFLLLLCKVDCTLSRLSGNKRAGNRRRVTILKSYIFAKMHFSKKLSFVNPFDTWPWRAQNWNTAFVLGPMSITIPQCVRTRLCLVNYMIRLRMSLIIMCIQVISWYLILSIVCCNFLQCQHHFSTAFVFGANVNNDSTMCKNAFVPCELYDTFKNESNNYAYSGYILVLNTIYSLL